MTHTPGPWHVGHFRNGCDIVGPHGEDIGYVNASDGADEPTSYPVEANARLIAAAPDLLAAARLALEEMVQTVATRNSFTDAVDALDAALAKAEGRS